MSTPMTYKNQANGIPGLRNVDGPVEIAGLQQTQPSAAGDEVEQPRYPDCACDDEGPCKLHGQKLEKWLGRSNQAEYQRGRREVGKEAQDWRNNSLSDFLFYKFPSDLHRPEGRKE